MSSTLKPNFGPLNTPTIPLDPDPEPNWKPAAGLLPRLSSSLNRSGQKSDLQIVVNCRQVENEVDN